MPNGRPGVNFLAMRRHLCSLRYLHPSASADRWILQGMFGSGAVGVYAAIYQIAASPVNIFFTMVSQLVVPIVFERAGAMTNMSQAESSTKLMRQTVAASSLVALVIAVVALVFSEPLVRILTNASFAVNHGMLPVMVWGCACSILASSSR
jgi:O-antigen/teichoic acid export membrane protein